jgi:hypothetical protein
VRILRISKCSDKIKQMFSVYLIKCTNNQYSKPSQNAQMKLKSESLRIKEHGN